MAEFEKKVEIGAAPASEKTLGLLISELLASVALDLQQANKKEQDAEPKLVSAITAYLKILRNIDNPLSQAEKDKFYKKMQELGDAILAASKQVSLPAGNASEFKMVESSLAILKNGKKNDLPSEGLESTPQIEAGAIFLFNAAKPPFLSAVINPRKLKTIPLFNALHESRPVQKLEAKKVYADLGDLMTNHEYLLYFLREQSAVSEKYGKPKETYAAYCVLARLGIIDFFLTKDELTRCCTPDQIEALQILHKTELEKWNKEHCANGVLPIKDVVKDVVSCALQFKKSLDVNAFWKAVVQIRGENSEEVRDLINKCIQTLVQDKAELIEQAEMVDSICNPQSTIHKLLTFNLSAEQEVDYVGYWTARQHAIHKERSAARLQDVISQSNDPDKVREFFVKVQDVNNDGIFSNVEIDSKENQGLTADQIRLKRRYGLLKKFSAKEGQIRSIQFREETPKATSCYLTAEDLMKLCAETEKAREKFQSSKVSEAKANVLPKTVSQLAETKEQKEAGLGSWQPGGESGQTEQSSSSFDVGPVVLPPPLPPHPPCKRPQGAGLLDQSGRGPSDGASQIRLAASSEQADQVQQPQGGAGVK